MSKARRTNLFFLGLILFYIIACFFFVPLIPDKYYDYNMAIIMAQLMIALPGIIYIIGTKGAVLKNIRFKRIGFLNIILLFLFTVFMTPAITFINAFSMMFVENHMVGQLNGMSDNPFWLSLVLVALLPAVIEEMTFRGLLYCGYRDSVIKRAIFASAILFGLFHMNINQFCYAAFMAVIFALLYEATGSIFATMTVHFIFNANTLVLQKLLELFQKFILNRAKYDEDFKEIANQITESGSQAATFADYPILEKISMLAGLFISAVMAGIIAVIIFKVLAQRFHRENHVKQILYSIVGKQCGETKLRENEYVEDNQKEYGGKIVDPVYVIGVVLCVVMMIYTGI